MLTMNKPYYFSNFINKHFKINHNFLKPYKYVKNKNLISKQVELRPIPILKLFYSCQ